MSPVESPSASNPCRASERAIHVESLGASGPHRDLWSEPRREPLGERFWWEYLGQAWQRACERVSLVKTPRACEPVGSLGVGKSCRTWERAM